MTEEGQKRAHAQGKCVGTFAVLSTEEPQTITGRLSTPRPNGQNIPYKTTEGGKRIRDLFGILPKDRGNWTKLGEYS